jgi:hypothetical protein
MTPRCAALARAVAIAEADAERTGRIADALEADKLRQMLDAELQRPSGADWREIPIQNVALGREVKSATLAICARFALHAMRLCSEITSAAIARGSASMDTPSIRSTRRADKR